MLLVPSQFQERTEKEESIAKLEVLAPSLRRNQKREMPKFSRRTLSGDSEAIVRHCPCKSLDG